MTRDAKWDGRLVAGFEAKTPEECLNRHHETYELAMEHLRKNHGGYGKVRKCSCRQGWTARTPRKTPEDGREEAWTARQAEKEKEEVHAAREETANPPRARMDIELAQNSCFRKTRYTSEKKANSIIQKRNFAGRTYSCVLCGGWHLTHKPLFRKER